MGSDQRHQEITWWKRTHYSHLLLHRKTVYKVNLVFFFFKIISVQKCMKQFSFKTLPVEPPNKGHFGRRGVLYSEAVLWRKVSITTVISISAIASVLYNYRGCPLAGGSILVYPPQLILDKKGYMGGPPVQANTSTYGSSHFFTHCLPAPSINGR